MYFGGTNNQSGEAVHRDGCERQRHRHTRLNQLGAGQLVLDPGQLQSDRPVQVGRQLAHPVSVALGKSLATRRASPGSVAE